MASPLPPEDARPRSSSMVSPSASPTEPSAIFTRIPPEIHRQILIEAFGGRVVHLKAIYAPRPPRPRYANLIRYRRHQRNMDPRVVGYVCYRSPSLFNYADTPPGHAQHESMPHADRCGSDDTSNEMADALHQHSVGATGWLRTCRRAYEEGVHVLYTTNIFHITSAALTRNLPLVIPERNRALIRRAYLMWYHMYPWLSDDEYNESDREGERSDSAAESQWKKTQTIGMQDVVETIDSLPSVLPNLRFMYLSLSGELLPPGVFLNGQEISDAIEKLLEPISKAVHTMQMQGQLADCRIALPTTCYGALKWKANGEDIKWGTIPGSVTEPETLWKEAGISDRVGEGSGYWLVHGVKDVPGRVPSDYWLSRGARISFPRPV